MACANIYQICSMIEFRIFVFCLIVRRSQLEILKSGLFHQQRFVWTSKLMRLQTVRVRPPNNFSYHWSLFYCRPIVAEFARIHLESMQLLSRRERWRGKKSRNVNRRTWIYKSKINIHINEQLKLNDTNNNNSAFTVCQFAIYQFIARSK